MYIYNTCIYIILVCVYVCIKYVMLLLLSILFFDIFLETYFLRKRTGVQWNNLLSLCKLILKFMLNDYIISENIKFAYENAFK